MRCIPSPQLAALIRREAVAPARHGAAQRCGGTEFEHLPRRQVGLVATSEPPCGAELTEAADTNGPMFAATRSHEPGEEVDQIAGLRLRDLAVLGEQLHELMIRHPGRRHG